MVFLDEELAIALRDAHCREDRRGAVRTEDEIDLLNAQEPLVERTRQSIRVSIDRRAARIRRPPAKLQPPLALVWATKNLADDLMNEAGLREGTRERQRLTDPDRHAGKRVGRCLGTGRGRNTGRLASPPITARRDQSRLVFAPPLSPPRRLFPLRCRRRYALPRGARRPGRSSRHREHGR